MAVHQGKSSVDGNLAATYAYIYSFLIQRGHQKAADALKKDAKGVVVLKDGVKPDGPSLDVIVKEWKELKEKAATDSSSDSDSDSDSSSEDSSSSSSSSSSSDSSDSDSDADSDSSSSSSSSSNAVSAKPKAQSKASKSAAAKATSSEPTKVKASSPVRSSETLSSGDSD
ncbi:hypothetical protein BV20DRAFT_1014341, partial [Pilatotrama ljubarskyi]